MLESEPKRKYAPGELTEYYSMLDMCIYGAVISVQDILVGWASGDQKVYILSVSENGVPGVYIRVSRFVYFADTGTRPTWFSTFG